MDKCIYLSLIYATVKLSVFGASHLGGNWRAGCPRSSPLKIEK
jgi:hypothetical protein